MHDNYIDSLKTCTESFVQCMYIGWQHCNDIMIACSKHGLYVIIVIIAISYSCAKWTTIIILLYVHQMILVRIVS